MMSPTFTVVWRSLVIGMLVFCSISAWQIQTTIGEMNARQKSVVVSQHKAIEDKIAQACGH